MNIEQVIPPPDHPEALFRIELGETELRALINRLVPEGTWMKARSAILIRKDYADDPAKAEELADQFTRLLIRAHDARTDPGWVRRI